MKQSTNRKIFGYQHGKQDIRSVKLLISEKKPNLTSHILERSINKLVLLVDA